MLNPKRKSIPGHLYLNVDFIAPSQAILSDWLCAAALWAKAGGNPQTQPKPQTTDTPTQTTVRFIGEFCYNPRDMWATLLNTANALAYGTYSREEKDLGAEWQMLDIRPAVPRQTKGRPQFLNWVEQHHFTVTADLVQQLRAVAQDLSRPERECPKIGYSALRLTSELLQPGHLFTLRAEISGKEYLITRILEIADAIQAGAKDGTIGTAGRWQIVPYTPRP